MNFRDDIVQALAKCCPVDASDIDSMLECPKDLSKGDYALPCFKLARVMKKAPPQIAQALAEGTILPPCICKMEVSGGYLNFYVDKNAFAEEVLSEVLSKGAAYGSSDEGAGRTVCVDYSSVNIAKPFGIHHLPSTALGNSLIHIFRHLGYSTVGMNFLGDYGTQFGKMIYAYLHWGERARVEANGAKELAALYARYHEEAEDDPSMDDEARAWFKKIEDGEAEALELFTWFKDITLKEVGRIYDMLGVTFDDYNGESFFNAFKDEVLDELNEKKLLVEDKGAMVVKLDEYNMPPCIFMRTDGATLYATRDIAAAFWRKRNYKFDKCLYVVAYQQDLHFRQWFKVVELMGHDWYKDLVHVSFGMVSMPEGSMSTRHGRVVWLEDVLTQAVEKVREIIEERSPDIEDKDTVAKQVGIGAVLFSALYTNRIKDTVFSFSDVLNFDGETAPYAQYTHARCISVLRKAEAQGKTLSGASICTLSGDTACQIINELAHFKDAVHEAAARYEPFVVARSVISICKAFNKFYYEERILDCAADECAAKLRLTKACATVIATGLGLLGISAPDRM